jgi:hypothetical protein
MDQYYKLFGTCRILDKNIDKIKIFQVYNIDLKKRNHITVMFNNRVIIISTQTNKFIFYLISFFLIVKKDI